MGTVIGMYAASTGGAQNALASIDVPSNGRLVGCDWSGTMDADADGDTLDWELSFGSVNTLTTNDSRSRISTLAMGNSGAASAPFMPGANHFVLLPEIPVGMGERIYLHASGIAALAGRVLCNLHFDFDLDKVPVRRR